MKYSAIVIAFAGALAPLAAPIAARAQAPDVVQKDAHGRAEKVRIDGKVYDVCRGDASDDCINPRAAGLHWGNRPLDHWPDKDKSPPPAH